MEAKFTPIPNFDGYYAGSDGFIYSDYYNWRGYGFRKLTPAFNKYGYLAINLMLGKNKRTTRRVHVLVCSAFHGTKPFDTLEVRHLDGNKENNVPSNLKWGTKSENALDRSKHGKPRGRYGNNQKLTIDQVNKIKKTDGKYVDIAKEYNVTPNTISFIRRGKTWN